jgi:hypothetical protein
MENALTEGFRHRVLFRLSANGAIYTSVGRSPT